MEGDAWDDEVDGALNGNEGVEELCDPSYDDLDEGAEMEQLWSGPNLAPYAQPASVPVVRDRIPDGAARESSSDAMHHDTQVQGVYSGTTQPMVQSTRERASPPCRCILSIDMDCFYAQCTLL